MFTSRYSVFCTDLVLKQFGSVNDFNEVTKSVIAANALEYFPPKP